jgi:hypothetical protein
MRRYVSREEQMARTAAPLAPAVVPWFLRALRRHPVPTIIGVIGLLLMTRSQLLKERLPR